MTPTARPSGTDSCALHVVGSLNLDTTLSVSRFPAPGATVMSTSRVRGVGGKGGNQAIAASRAGGDVVMAGGVGSDAEGAAILRDLAAAGVQTAGVRRHAGPSGAAIVIVDDQGENVIVVSPGANALVDGTAIGETLRDLRRGDTIVLQNEIPPAANAHAALLGRSAGATVIWNAAPAPASRAEIPSPFDILVVNEGELLAVARSIGADDNDPMEAMAAVARTLDVDVVCTRGAAGALALVDGIVHEVAAPVVNAVDTTGAGDTFVGFFAASAHLPIADRLRVAAAAGAAAVTRSGAAASIPDRDAVAELLTPLIRTPPKGRT